LPVPVFTARIIIQMMPFIKESSSNNKEDYYKKLTVRNTFFNLILFVSPFLLLFFIVNYEATSLIKNQIYSRLADIVEENTKTLNIFFRDREIDLRSYSKLDIERVEEVNKFSAFLNSLIQEKEWYDFLVIADLDGDIVLSINREIEGNIADREYFKISKEGRPHNSGIFYSDILNAPVMVLSHPLMNRANQIIGVLVVSVNLENFYNLLFGLRMAETSELFLVDNEGTLLSPTKLGGQLLVDKGFYTEEGNPHTGDEGVKTHYDYRGQKVLCAYKKLPQTNFYIVSEMDLEEALLPVREVNRIILYVFSPFFLILVLISTLYSRRITSLLRRLTKDLEKALSESRAKKKEVDAVNIELEEKVKESEQLAKDLRLSEEYIRNLIDSISLGVIGLDCSGKITHYNREFKELFNLEDLKKGQDVFSILSWLSEKDVKLAFENTISGNTPNRIEEKKIETDGGEESYNLSFFPIEERKDKITGVTLIIDNITERKRLREQLAEYEKLSALSQLALGAAHEINNPLQGISSYLEILLGEAKEKEKEEIEYVLENVSRISETIRGLLNFARPTPPQFTKVNVNNLIDDTISFLSHQPIFRKVKIKKSLPQPTPQITADLNQIRQVLINMFLNAAQSMPDGGELRVETSKVKFKEFIQIDISDTGLGIPLENIKKIFDPFFTTKKKQGTGLGLSISLSYIKSHNGDIEVKSELNQGTTFSICLPIRQKGRILLKDEETIS